MPWFKIDDGFHGHPKVLELSLPAVGLWTLSGSWCASYLTDGEITLKAIGRLGGDRDTANELVDAGLWLEASTGTFQFKDWADYQPLKADVEAERDAARERMKKVRANKKGTNKQGSGEQPPNVPPNDAGTFEPSAPEVRIAPSHPFPSQPSPTPLLEEPTEATLHEVPNTDPPRSSYPDHFERVWALYPNRRDKKAAYKAYVKACKEVSPERIEEGVLAYRDDPTREQKFTKHFSTWLNAGSWEDEILPPTMELTSSERRMKTNLERGQSWQPSIVADDVFARKALGA